MTDPQPEPSAVNKIINGFLQIEELRRENTDQAKAQYHQQREALIQQMQEHFAERLKQTKGIITQDILQEADQFYQPGLAITLANTLLVEPSQLRRMLSRKREIECERCHHMFTVIETRTTKGYNKSYRRLCDDCQEEQNETRQIEHERTVGELQQNMVIDHLLMRKQNPLEVPEFKSHLEHMARYWLDGDVYQTWMEDPESSRGLFPNVLGLYYQRCGCMACGATPVRIFWTKNNDLSEKHPLIHLMESLERRNQEYHSHQDNDEAPSTYSAANIIRPAQLAWRLDPGEYFSGIPHFPLRSMPLLLLCDGCISLARGTHAEVFPGTFFSPADGNA